MGRGFSLGKVEINQQFFVIPALDDFDEYILSSTTKISFPLSENLSFVNNLFVRYCNQTILEGEPKVNSFFSTGLEYKF